MLKSDLSTRGIMQAKSWPVTIVAVLYRFQGLLQVYSAIIDGRAAGQPTVLGGAAFAVLDGVFGIVLVGASLGLFARIKASLTVATFLAAFNLFGVGAALIEATFGPTEWHPVLPEVLVLVVVACLQYMILRSVSTIALFSRS
jgi:CHASE2 domain-containing sensor protein